MTTTELNTYLSERVDKLIHNGGIKDTQQQRDWLLGCVTTQWLTQHNWEQTQPHFWYNPNHKNHCVFTDNLKVSLMVCDNPSDGNLDFTDTFPHPTK